MEKTPELLRLKGPEPQGTAPLWGARPQCEATQPPRPETIDQGLTSRDSSSWGRSVNFEASNAVHDLHTSVFSPFIHDSSSSSRLLICIARYPPPAAPPPAPAPVSSLAPTTSSLRGSSAHQAHSTIDVDPCKTKNCSFSLSLALTGPIAPARLSLALPYSSIASVGACLPFPAGHDEL